MEKRLKYYTDRLSSTLLKRGDNYCKTKKIISIAILNHKFYKKRKNIYRHEYQILNKRNHSIFDDNPLEIIIFDKLKKEDYDINNLVDSLFMYLYGLLTRDELEQLISKDNLIKDIEEAKNMISKTKEAEILKIGIEKRKMDEQVRIQTAIKNTWKKAEKKGIKEGIKEEKVNLTLKLMNKGFSLKEISDITDLPIEEIEKLTSNVNSSI
jgi:predicted transposase/invertase (TIGR01784 family)